MTSCRLSVAFRNGVQDRQEPVAACDARNMHHVITMYHVGIFAWLLCCIALQMLVMSHELGIVLIRMYTLKLVKLFFILLQSALHARLRGKITIKDGPKAPRKKSFREKRKATKQKLTNKLDSVKWGIRGFFRVRCAACCSAPATKI